MAHNILWEICMPELAVWENRGPNTWAKGIGHSPGYSFTGKLLGGGLLRQGKTTIRKVDEARLPTEFGDFVVHAFRESNGREHVALVRGDVSGKSGVHVRVHSACLTGDAFASRKCDCGEQLSAALRHIDKEGIGILIYLDQEGRGIGLVNKIRAYALQDKGMDTVEANVHLGFKVDQRDYAAAAEMLKSLGVDDIALLTNNPQKIADLERHGIRVERRIPLIIDANEHNRHYLETKKEKTGHML